MCWTSMAEKVVVWGCYQNTNDGYWHVVWQVAKREVYQRPRRFLEGHLISTILSWVRRYNGRVSSKRGMKSYPMGG